jgi:hypothetical protein
MNHKQSVIACAAVFAAPLFLASNAALAGGSGSPCAAEPTAFTAFDFSDTLTVLLSGATAPSKNLSSKVREMFTKNGSAQNECYTYQDDNGNANLTVLSDMGKLHFAHFGKMRADSDIPESLRNKKVLFIKRDEGGSVWGVNPVARGSRVRTLAVDSTNCTATIGGVWRCSIAGIDPGFPNADTSANNGRVPDFGVSDVEPAMFKSPFNVEFGQEQLTSDEAARLTPSASQTLMMGFVTTNAVSSAVAITRAQYGNLLMGNIRDWRTIDPSIAESDAKKHVIICRRVPGSGTQASYNWYFNNFPCQNQFAGTVAPARMIDDSIPERTGSGTTLDPYKYNPADGFLVLENSGSGDVRNCMQKAQNGGKHTFLAEDKSTYEVDFGAGGYRAVAVLSLDSLGNENGWNFRTQDGSGRYLPSTQACVGGDTCTGVPPSKQNLLQGAYDFAVELSFQIRNTAVNNPQGDNTPALSGDKLTFYNEFLRRVSDPTLTNNSNAALPNLFTPVISAAGAITNNVARAMRGFPTANSCKPLQFLF